MLKFYRKISNKIYLSKTNNYILDLDKLGIISKSKKNVFNEIHKLLETNIPKLLISFNLDSLRITFENNRFLDICLNNKFIIQDSIGITSLLRIKHNLKYERITGSELFQYLLNLSKNDKKLKYAFVGSSEYTLSKLKLKITQNFPNLNNALYISPIYNFESIPNENKNLLIKLKEFKPNILILALGCPRQEMWLYENMNIIGAKINIGLGAVFDFYAGSKKRSPVIFQKFGLEWFWRLLNEPARLYKRYLIKGIPFYIRYIIK